MSRFCVVGMNDDPHPRFSPEVNALIASHRVFSGGQRHRQHVASLLPPDAVWIPVQPPLEAVFEQYASHDEIIVFASGDPLFYGFAVTLRRRWPDAAMQVYPAFHSLQTLARHLALPYHDLRAVSLTGRPWHELDRALIERAERIGVLTDREHTPATIARRLIDYGYTDYIMYIGEHLGHLGKQRIRRMTPLEAAETDDFGTPNCLILSIGEGMRPRPRPFGIPDASFDLLDGRERMITKSPIRLLTLQMLDLRERRHFWDVGFCTGSVSIEAKMQFPHLHVTAFEIREEGRELMQRNSRRMGTPDIHTVIGDFLAVPLPETAPDAVFIGGHGGQLQRFMQRIAGRLAPGGVVVFNSVSEESRRMFVAAVESTGFVLQRQMRVAVDAHHPITLCCAGIS